MKTYRQLVPAIAAALIAAGCTTIRPALELPRPLAIADEARGAENAGANDSIPATNSTDGDSSTRTQRTEAVPTTQAPFTGIWNADPDRLPVLTGGPITSTFESLPLPAFVNAVFGEQLKLNFRIAPDLANAQDVVTFRIPEPTPPSEVYKMAISVLSDYGVSATLEDGLMVFARASATASTTPPLIVSGRSLPDVPNSHRPVFQIVELEFVRTNDVTPWLTGAMKIEGLEVLDDNRRNRILLKGRPSAVNQALSAIRVLDRASLKGRHGLRIEPAFLSPTELAAQVTQALNAQGYAAASTLDGLANAVLVLPLNASNSVLVFASSKEVLDTTVSWARTLDKPAASQTQRSLFYYQVKNTRASDIATVLGVQTSSTGAATQSPTSATESPTQRQGEISARAGRQASAGGGFDVAGQVVIDEPRNALVFRGAPAEWAQLRPLIEEMDRAPRQVLVEVTIAEVTLDDNLSYGLSWFAKDSHGRFNGRWNSGVLGSSSSSTSSSGGLSYLIDVAGQNRAQLRAFADDSRVAILSTPRLLVKSGNVASIDVGTEVPTITSQTTSNQQTNGDTGLLQAIQYRKTGILLEVSPIVYSDDRIDLEIRQEVSEALPLSSGATVPSPSIFTRSVSTTLGLRDGGSIVIGGLMSERSTVGSSGVPGLKDVPLLGSLFRSQANNKNRTELVIMIVPYILDQDDDAKRMTDAALNELELLQAPSN